jgi:hypothetical protein
VIIIPKKVSKNKKYVIAALAIVLLLFLVYFLAFSPYSPFVSDDDSDSSTPTTKIASTITLIDYASGEDVSDWMEVSIWLPDDDAEFDDEDDPYRLSNFDEDVQSVQADHVDEDLRNVEYAWLEIDPDDRSPFSGHNTAYGGIAAGTDDFRPLVGGANYDYIFYVYHPPENVTVNALTRTINAGGPGGNVTDWIIQGFNIFDLRKGSPIGDEWNGWTCSNLTIVMDQPNYDVTDPHYGDTGIQEWDIDDDEYADMDAEEREWIFDHRNWRTAAPLYDIADDLDKEYDEDLNMMTNAFVVRFRFNTTVSEVDGATTEVNATLMERNFDAYDIEIVYSNDTIYCIFTEPKTWADELLSFDIQITMGTAINCTGDSATTLVHECGVFTGRLTLPYDDAPIGVFTQLAQAPLPRYCL